MPHEKKEVNFVCSKCGWKWSGDLSRMWIVMKHEKKHKQKPK